MSISSFSDNESDKFSINLTDNDNENSKILSVEEFDLKVGF